MRRVPTLMLAAALTLGAGASFAADQTYRVYNADGSYTTYVLPGSEAPGYRVYNGDGTYAYVVPVTQQPQAQVTEYRFYNRDGSYSTYVVQGSAPAYQPAPQVVYTAPEASLYAAPTETYVYRPSTPYATYQAQPAYPQQGVTRQDGDDVFLVRYDTDGDGDLSDEQTVMRTRAQIAAENGKVQLLESHAVEPVDANGDGFITADEWRAEHGAYFGSLDLNNDGRPDQYE